MVAYGGSKDPGNEIATALHERWRVWVITSPRGSAALQQLSALEFDSAEL
jgi:hypothetical protein